MAAKVCRECGEAKPLDDFTRRAASADGRDNRCKKCARAYQAERRARTDLPARECAVDACDKQAAGSGRLCAMHRSRKWRRGTTDDPPPRGTPLADRISRIGWAVTESGCWEWRGSRDANGYGRYSRRDGSHLAHRIVYSLLVGGLRDDEVLRHSCDNPPCVNPDHLTPGTPADNVEDASKRNRLYSYSRPDVTHCRNGHDVTQPGSLSTVSPKGRNPHRKCVQCAKDRMARFEERREQRIEVDQ